MLKWRLATEEDAGILGSMNLQLIEDEHHRNPMALPELEERMREWLRGHYTAVIFEINGREMAYALFHPEDDFLYLRQFFVARDLRRSGLGREAIRLLRCEVWPRDIKLVVTALCQNTAAIAFWRAVGFSDYCLSLEILPEEHQ